EGQRQQKTPKGACPREEVVKPRGTPTVTTYEEQEYGSMEPVSWGIRFGCEACHNPRFFPA
ncbi:hypothetical protein, partial [Calderihabitans maritimus]